MGEGIDPALALGLLRQHAASKAREPNDSANLSVKRSMGQALHLPGTEPRRPAEAASPLPIETVPQLQADWSVARLGTYVLTLEAKRVETYAHFEQLLERCKLSGAIDAYADGCAIITANFNALSMAINHAETQLRRCDRPAAAACVKALQIAEKEKLELTAARHFASFRSDQNSIDYIRTRLANVLEAINLAIDDLKAETYDDVE